MDILGTAGTMATAQMPTVAKHPEDEFVWQSACSFRWRQVTEI
jgi:hypothetical protein